MKSHLALLFVSGALVLTSGAVLAHHSFAMFDQEHPMEVNGIDPPGGRRNPTRELTP